MRALGLLAAQPVPVRENDRIPEIAETINAQHFAARMIALAPAADALIDALIDTRADTGAADLLADRILSGGRAFAVRLMAELAGDTGDAFRMLLVLRRLERLFGAPRPLVPATIVAELREMAATHLALATSAVRALLGRFGPVVPLGSEAEFETATVSAVIYGWAQELIRLGIDWSVAAGMAPGAARALMARTFTAAGRMVDERAAPPEAWHAACETVAARLGPGADDPAGG